MWMACGLSPCISKTRRPDTLRGMMDKLRDAAPDAVGALIGTSGEKTTLAVGVGKQALTKGLKAGVLVKQIAAVAGGNGGGKPDFAMAGIRNLDKVDAALRAVAAITQRSTWKRTAESAIIKSVAFVRGSRVLGAGRI